MSIIDKIPGLFSESPESHAEVETKGAPLAERMRPKNINEVIGQQHLLGEGKLLRRVIEDDAPISMILWGPPGTGKTTLARVIAEHTSSEFIPFSAVVSGIKEIRQVMVDADRMRKSLGRRTVLFIDEIHRFNKSQQDAFLPYVEDGTIILIGATTENPSFEINSALLSRVKVLVLNQLTEIDIINILRIAVEDKDRGLGSQNLVIADALLTMVAQHSGGDGRSALNTLEISAANSKANENNQRIITEEDIQEAMQHAPGLYDKTGEQHYNLISAFIKSIRNSDANATLYWLARMIEGGEDPMFIVRRIVHHASEDIGLADPQALVIATAAAHAVHLIGLPEAKLALAEASVYLANAPKSNSVITAYEAAAMDARATQSEPVPLHLRNAVTSLMKNLDYGKNYKYAHEAPSKKTDMICLPEKLKDRSYFKQ